MIYTIFGGTMSHALDEKLKNTNDSTGEKEQQSCNFFDFSV